ncbi:MAG: hypothetical protein NWP79_05820 [Paracoccaceae bacterium]|nr:hypothetical protein [Paracoccaceae bacterium]
MQTHTAKRVEIVIEARDPLFSKEKTQEFLTSLGATEIELVEDED